MADPEEEPPEEGEEENAEEEVGEEENVEEEEVAKVETENPDDNKSSDKVDEAKDNLEILPPMSPFQKSFDISFLKLPEVSTEPCMFEPKLYTFRVPNADLNNAYMGKTCYIPPFHILLDHTIGVVWAIFCNANLQEPLGANQLHWALLFIKSVKNRYGGSSPDIKVCIEAIEENLISIYSTLAEILPEQPPEVENKLISFNYIDTLGKMLESEYLRKSRLPLPDIDENVPKDEIMKELEQWKITEQKNVKFDIGILISIDKFMKDLQNIKTYAEMGQLLEAIAEVKEKVAAAQDDESEGEGSAAGGEEDAKPAAAGGAEEASEDGGEEGDEEDAGEEAAEEDEEA